MQLSRARTFNLGARLACLALAAGLLAAGCVTGGSQSTGSPSAVPTDSAGPSGSAGPSDSVSPSGFYLRMWQTQAVAPVAAFGQLPQVTISDGMFIDGRVAIPMIYPGPLWIGPSVRTITAAGIASIVAEARTAGLLGTVRDFADGSVAGTVTGHIEMTVEGTTYDLTGPVSMPDGGAPTPGTAAAFETFWQKLGDASSWVASALGSTTTYEPTRLAVLATAPAAVSVGVTAADTAWPLTTPFASFGSAFGGTADRCAVVSGADLASLISVVKQSNQLTRFVDAQGAKDSLVVRVLVPGEPSPCV